MKIDWNARMPDDQFARLKKIIDAPSPVGHEAAMTYGVLKPYYEEVALDGWKVHQFVGNASVVLDTHPGRDDLFTVMIVGHADKIRMQVRSIDNDGKIWINSDSFLPQTLIGHEVILFSRDPENLQNYRAIKNGTIEAISAIHLAPPDIRSGKNGIKPEMLYLELQMHGKDRKKTLEALGILPGDPILLNRPLKRGSSPNTIYGAYLDNGLGCFVTTELATLIAQYVGPDASHGSPKGFNNIRVLLAAATHEEIGRMGSRVLAAHFKPDALIAVDVSHDYDASPLTKGERHPHAAMGEGFTLKHGAVGSTTLNRAIMEAVERLSIPCQHILAGRDFGTDAMASAFASVDSATTSIGFPIRNMHTISETGHTGDILGAIAAIFETLKMFDVEKVSRKTFKDAHPRLDLAIPLNEIAYNDENE